MEEISRLLILKIEQVRDSEGNPCTRSEADAILRSLAKPIAAEMVRTLVLNHPLLEENAQDLLDEKGFVEVAA
ncbi:MAG: hypothetical protein KME13_23885 [Myxacorys californica WJT36-NPBG1]|jgi:hypothetical protein|nr:hypothetical protein [Myxacorys californica WJT36-NPBG1]